MEIQKYPYETYLVGLAHPQNPHHFKGLFIAQMVYISLLPSPTVEKIMAAHLWMRTFRFRAWHSC